MNAEPTEFHLKYRPKSFKTVFGQQDAVTVLTRMIEAERVPHSIMFVGPSGCGKTTLARILAKQLECGKADLEEINAADVRGIDKIREIRTRMMLSPLFGKCRIFILDEAHKLSNDAQNALLKMLEDTPQHVYFMLATTDPAKIIKTIHTRCTEIRVRDMNAKSIGELIDFVTGKESMELSQEVKDKIIECSMNSGRMALVLLNKIVGIEDEDERLSIVAKHTENKEAFEFAKELICNPRAQWVDLAKLINAIEEEPETVRWIVLSFATSVMLKGGKLTPRAYLVLEEFRDNFFDSKKAGLVRAAYAVVTGS